MPTYEYYSKETHEKKEVFHSMSDEPEILDSRGNKMKKMISGGLGFTIKDGGTIRRSWGQRHGHKVSSSNPTPSESAQNKAQIAQQESSPKQTNSDPYSGFRD